MNQKKSLPNQHTYWVEFIDYDGVQRNIYLRGESVEQIKTIMDQYEIVVIDNTEIREEPYWDSNYTTKIFDDSRVVYKLQEN